MKKIVIDTNVLYSALRSKNGASFRLVSLIGTGLFDVHLSVPLCFEYESVLLRENSGLILSVGDVNNVLNYVCSVSILHDVYFLWRPILKDSGDDMVLELAVKSGADVIVTFNKSDFEGAELFGISILNPQEFLQICKQL